VATIDGTLRKEQVEKQGIFGVCTCGYVCVNKEDHEAHVKEHYLSFCTDVNILYSRM
jgi:hypothetical protein